MRASCLLAFAVLSLGLVAADFEERSLSVDIIINSDASAHVEESIAMFISGQPSRDLYESPYVYNDLSSWRERTGIDDIQNHITRAVASIENLRVRPQPVGQCNNVAKTCHATLVWEYDVNPISQNQTAFVKADYYKPRTTRYSVNREAFGIPVGENSSIVLNRNGDIKISRLAQLEITIPHDAQKVFFSKPPGNLEEGAQFSYDQATGKKYYVGKSRAFIWSGETLPQFELSYEREDTLESEIFTFFATLQYRVFSLIVSYEGIALILLAAIFAASVIALHSLSRSSA